MKKAFFKIGLAVTVLLFTGAGCFQLIEEEDISTTGPAGVFVSADKGEKTWQQISLVPQPEGVVTIDNVGVYRLFNDPQDPNAMYWASRGNGLFYSYDEGRSWRISTTPFNTGFVYSVAVHPKRKCTIFATNGPFIYKTEDCTRSWEEVHREDRADARVSSLMFDPAGDNDIFAAKLNGDIIKSTDEGKSWTVTHRLAKRVDSFQADVNATSTFYLSTNSEGLYRSEDGGQNWELLDKGLAEFPGGLNYRKYLVHPTKANTIYWISTYGILVSRNKGETWEAIKLITSPGSADLYGFDINPQNDKEMYYTATLGGKSTFYKTADGGATWSTKKLPSGQVPTVLRVHPANENVVYLGFSIPPQ